jgi:hypothetical protein
MLTFTNQSLEHIQKIFPFKEKSSTRFDLLSTNAEWNGIIKIDN